MVIGFIGIQFIPVNLNQSNTIPKEDIILYYNAPTEIADLLKNSCYDCHSNNTNYQWYNKIKPIYWLMQVHIVDGKEELNFNEFATYSKRRQKSKIKSIISQIKDDEMPLGQYTLMHKSAILSDQDEIAITKWMETLRDSL